ncbi:adenosine deaminase [Actinoplanes sp. N902-109]|uniref:adenosine deaminase n=1 Tax=Actinoplanes sp. (strain N902-109) TaxID=649831 RepID=UPI00032946B9|nr:adenosine deaminase [Actinoplanes sp. N902-109]AGL17828.1 adenosine deaminase [Actinoplanes sp. N902-109]
MLPLIDLHRHLEGSIRPSTFLHLARRDGHPFATVADPRAELVADRPLGGLLPYLAKVDDRIGVIATLDDWHRVAREAVSDAFDDGLDYVEVRFSPYFIRQQTGLAPEAVIDAVADGIAAGSAVTGLPVGLIGIVLRDLGPAAAAAQIATFLTRRDVWCGVDLAGNEAGYAAELFRPAFATARDAGLHITVHAGEAAGPESVRAAVRELGAERIGHGVRAVEDPRLPAELAERGVTLEVALTSNTQTGAAPSYAGHQIHELLAAGVGVTLNTDNPRVSHVTLSQEFALARHAAGLTHEQLRIVAHQAVTAAFSERVPRT